MENGWELPSALTSKWITFKNIQSNFTLISLITFEVPNQTSPNLQGCCRNTCRWCLQNYMENGWELPSELTSKWITFKNTLMSIKFHTNLINNFWSTSKWIKLRQIYRKCCRNTCRWCLQNYMENRWELTSGLTSKWMNFKNTQSNFTLISLITFEVLYQTLPNFERNCRNTCRWCLQNYIGNGWQLTSTLTSKWMTFKNIQ